MISPSIQRFCRTLLYASVVGLALAAGVAWAADLAAHPKLRPAPPKSARIRSLPPGINVPAYSPGPMPFHDGEELTYRASWMGIPAAGAKLALHRDRQNPSLWTAEAWIATGPPVDLFYRMRDYLRENFSIGSFTPIKMYIRQRENHRHDDYSVTFNHSDRLVTLEKRNSRGVRITRFRSGHPWGMMSGAVMALSQPLKVGKNYTYDVFSATSRYVLRFDVVGREKIKTPLGSFEALKIEPWVRYLSDAKWRQEARKTTVWVSDDDRRLPLRIEAEMFFGTVRVDLVKVEMPQEQASK
ncbi:MAG: DUF3108 domain-containing protein [Candidatus Binataceae bacterium]